MISRKSLFGKLDLTCFRAIESATALAKIRGHEYVELIHWVHQLLHCESSARLNGQNTSAISPRLPDLSASWLDAVKGSSVIERITADAAVHDASSSPADTRIVCQVERAIPD